MRADGLEHVGLERRIAACRRLLIHARMCGWDITHVHPRSASHASPPVDGLQPLPSERLIYRTGVSAFSNRSFRHAIKASPEAELVLISFSLSSSCLATVLTAHDWGVPVILAADTALGSNWGSASREAANRGGEVDDVALVVRSIVAPFARIAAADELIEARRGLRLVVNEARV